MTTLLDFNLIAEKYNLAERRLIMLDYDGTLVPFAEDPRLALPDNRLKTILWELNTDRRNEVVLISGRKKDELELYFGEAGMTWLQNMEVSTDCHPVTGIRPFPSQIG